MWGGAQVLAALTILAGSCVVAKKYNITVGYLPCVTGEFRDRQGLIISGALSMALEEINNSTDILPDVTLLLQWGDTKCDTLTTNRLIIDMICSGVVAFFGPEERCQIAAVNAQSRNLPMISYKCSDYHDSRPTNFVRLDPSATKISKSVVSLLRYYRWNKFSILHEVWYAKAALTLEDHAKMMNMTLNHRRAVDDTWNQIIMDTKNETRIYVFLGSISALVEMMNTMETLQLFARGEYMVIYVDMMPHYHKDPLEYLCKNSITHGTANDRLVCPKTAEFRKRAQSLLVVTSSEPDRSYENFVKNVEQYNRIQPFNFPLNLWNKNKFTSLYAAYLYDSVRLYATALHSLIEEETEQRNETLTFEKLMRVATDGSRVVFKMKGLTSFKSVSGSSIRLDENGDANANSVVLAYKALSNTSATTMSNNCPHTMTPVGHFQETTKMFPVYKVNPSSFIDWPDHLRPEDEPACGFLNEKC